MTQSPFSYRLGPTGESLRQRHELFRLMQNSHLRWMDETNDPNLEELHRALADHFQVLIEQYEVLLKAIQPQGKLDTETIQVLR